MEVGEEGMEVQEEALFSLILGVCGIIVIF